MGSEFSALCCSVGGGKKEAPLPRSDHDFDHGEEKSRGIDDVGGESAVRKHLLLASQSSSDVSGDSTKPSDLKMPPWKPPPESVIPEWKPVATPILSGIVPKISKLIKEPEIREVMNAPGCILGESPHWCAITKSLFYIDIQGKKIHRYDPLSNVVDTMNTEQQVGFAIPSVKTVTNKIILIVGLEDSIAEINFTDKTTIRTLSAVPEKDLKDKRFNDGKCNPTGRLYAGYMHAKWREGKFGNLYTLISDNLRPLFDSTEFHLPNGSAWIQDIDGSPTMYMIDSGAHEIRKYKEIPHEVVAPPPDSPRGDAKTRRGMRRVNTVYTLPEDEVCKGYMMDGMTVDADGKLWVALVGAFCVIRIDPKTQTEIRRISLPAKKPTACTFGGEDLSTLYITSRSEGLLPDGQLWTARIDGIRGMSAGIPVSSL